MSDTITIVNGPTQAVTVGGGSTVQNVSVAPAPSLQVVVGQVQQQSLASMNDVVLTTPANGDVLRYQSNKWRNYPEADIVIDGQNF
jgi:protein-disulfide isomerase